MVDCGIFADTGAEPKSVYDWIKYLQDQCSYPIYVVKYSNLDEDIRNAVKGTEKSFSIPFYALNKDTKEKSLLSRQCTDKYKISPIIKNKFFIFLYLFEANKTDSLISIPITLEFGHKLAIQADLYPIPQPASKIIFPSKKDLISFSEEKP